MFSIGTPYLEDNKNTFSTCSCDALGPIKISISLIASSFNSRKICFSLSIYGIITMRKLPNQVAQVNALPITNKVVVIDAGHRSSR